HPRANASVDETTHEIVFKDYFHIGVAVDTEAGLIVPVIRDVDKRNLLQLSQELHELTEKSRQRKISLEELQGGSFTISNQGSIGGSHFTPIIYAPQVAILGVGQGQAKPVVIEGKVVVRTLLPLCLAYDHRVLDGADAVRFLKDIIAGIESFDETDLLLRQNSSMEPTNTEILVLGAGPGGYTAAFYAADKGKKVTLVEQNRRLGGICLNVGCIP